MEMYQSPLHFTVDVYRIISQQSSLKLKSKSIFALTLVYSEPVLRVGWLIFLLLRKGIVIGGMCSVKDDVT